MLSKLKNLSIKRLVLLILILIMTIIGGTFAWITYQSKKSSLVLNIGDINNLNVVIKPYQIKEIMQPVDSYNSGIYSQITITNNRSATSNLNLYYKINEITNDAINNGLKYTITSSNTINGTYSEITTGDFSNIENNELIIKEIEQPANTTTYYRVYLWLDSSIGNQTELENTKLNIELNASSYVISVNNKEGGTITTSTNIASFGKSITIIPTPITNYLYNGATIKYANGTTYMTLDKNTTKFTMPDDNITIVPNWKLARSIPEFTYTGSYQIVNDSDAVISNVDTYEGNWKIRFLTSGTLTFTSLNGAENGIDVFLVGGGGGGHSASGTGNGGGGGGGYTATYKGLNIFTTSYDIVIGAGGDKSTNGGATIAFEKSVSGGIASTSKNGGNGGSGGGGGETAEWEVSGSAGAGGVDGGNGGAGTYGGTGGTGQGATTREFGESSGKLYSTGGTGGFTGNGGGGGASGASGGGDNTGGGGGGGANMNWSQNYEAGKSGGSGIVIIRNKR